MNINLKKITNKRNVLYNLLDQMAYVITPIRDDGKKINSVVIKKILNKALYILENRYFPLNEEFFKISNIVECYILNNKILIILTDSGLYHSFILKKDFIPQFNYSSQDNIEGLELDVDLMNNFVLEKGINKIEMISTVSNLFDISIVNELLMNSSKVLFYKEDKVSSEFKRLTRITEGHFQNRIKFDYCFKDINDMDMEVPTIKFIFFDTGTNEIVEQIFDFDEKDKHVKRIKMFSSSIKLFKEHCFKIVTNFTVDNFDEYIFISE